MAVNIGPKIGIDGEAQFRKELNNIIQQSKTLSSEMKAVTSAFDENDNSQEKLTAQSEVLKKQLELQQKQVELLEKGVKAATERFDDADANTQRWKKALFEARAQMNNTKKAIDNLENSTDDVGQAMQEAKDDTLSFGDALKANLGAGAIIEGIKSITGSIANIAEESREYRKVMASLEISSQKAGYTAEETAQSYEKLYGVLGDDQTAATTVANLQAIGLEQDDLTKLTDAAIGAWATYGDSIPIDGLSEAINETIKAGQVTGTFADVLNWGSKESETFGVKLKSNTEANEEWNKSVSEAKTAEDFFNLALQDAGTEAERANLIMQAMADQGLSKAGDAWQKNNASLVEANKNQVKMNESMAKVGESVNNIKNKLFSALMPAIETVSSKFSESLNNIDMDAFSQKISDLISTISSNGPSIISVISGIGAAFLAWNVSTMIQGVITSISALSGVLPALRAGIVAINTAMKSNVISIVITAIAAITTGLITLWNTNEDFRNAVIAAWNAISGAFSAVWGAIATFFTETLPNAFNSVLQFIQNNWQGLLLLIVNPFAGAFKLLYDNCEWFRDFINNLWSSIYNTLVSWWDGIISFFTETIPDLISNIGQWFSELPYKIGYALGQAIGNIIKFGQSAWSWVTNDLPKIITGIINWFAKLPGKIWEWLLKTIDKIKSWGTNTYNSMVKTATNTITAVGDWFAKLPGRVWSSLTSIISKVSSWGKNLVQTATNAAKNTFNNVIDWFQKLPGKIFNIGKNIVEGLWNGIRSMWDWLWGNVTGFFGGLVDGIKNTLGIHSPSKVLRDEVGKMLPPGIVLGVESAMPKAIRQIDSMFSDLISAASRPIPQMSMEESGNHSINYNGGINISVQAAPGMDINALVSEIERRLAAATARREAVW